ncbi:NAD(P)/FAD-dependent oxidoreductase [Mycobacteroides abscessus]|uniref:NAD(P)/FAD-dependent oxidoreductase n=1 Tax=Mycobacteroides abscessus TaxID=36809 RepID=UPI000C2575DF|nr:NAD(P)/FAD-dependent oxidoreductase [Mycobacteroides abscessus]
MEDTVDVAVVGSGPAGCSAAIMLGRSGLRVALLEAHCDPDHYKRLCTHSLRSSVLPTLKRLGITEDLEQCGAVTSNDALWTRYGWLQVSHPHMPISHGYNVSRRVLDPLMRTTAAAVPTVKLMRGARVRDLTFDADGRASGVVADTNGSQRHIGAKLIVGADGFSSTVARLASMPGHISPNNRFLYSAEYLDIKIPKGRTTALWFLERDVAYVFRNENDVTLLTVMPAKDRLPKFHQNREAALLEMFANLSDGPDLTNAKRISNIIGTVNYPSITRKRIVAPGVALVGDAAMVGDPLWGTGCAWGFQTAEWLSDAVADALHSGCLNDIDAAARRYQRQHRRRVLPHQLINIDFAKRLRLNPLHRFIFAAGARDPRIASAVLEVGSRNKSPFTLLSPPLVARAALARVRP